MPGFRNKLKMPIGNGFYWLWAVMLCAVEAWTSIEFIAGSLAP